jgi:hypothetical protein
MLSALGLRELVFWNQLWWMVICAVRLSVQPMPKVLLFSAKWFQDTVRFVVSLRLSSSPSFIRVSRLWSIQMWSVTVCPPAPPVVGPRPRPGREANPSGVLDQLRPGPVLPLGAGEALVGGVVTLPSAVTSSNRALA